VSETTAAYHQEFNDRLKILPEEIAQGLSPAAEIVDVVKEHFSSPESWRRGGNSKNKETDSGSWYPVRIPFLPNSGNN
jgi:hypothetical protein